MTTCSTCRREIRPGEPRVVVWTYVRDWARPRSVAQVCKLCAVSIGQADTTPTRARSE